MRPLFIIGNKRSGTSQLVRLLNLHPEVFVSHESDIVWILYQQALGQEFRPHHWDSGRGMHNTLRSHGEKLRREASPWENFREVQLALMESGSPWLRKRSKPDLRWLGDKHPFQHTDPRLFEFILRNFPEPHFLHIVRHPFAVVASSERFNQSRDGDFWRGLTLRQKLDRWAFHEARVLELGKKKGARIHTLRYEDLCRRTEEEMRRIFEFLELNADPAILRAAARQTYPVAHPFAGISCSGEAADLARRYGYDLDRPKSEPLAWAEAALWRALKRLKYGSLVDSEKQERDRRSPNISP